MRKTIMVACITVLAFAACASKPPVNDLAFESATLFGMIYDIDNQPCAGVTVSLDGNAGLVTDVRGRFVLQDVARGDHTVVASKEGYETLTVQISFLNMSDILHLQVTSFKQCLDLAEKALSEKRWDDAEGFLKRAERLDPEDSVLLYMKAIYAYKTGAYDEAVKQLNAIVQKGEEEPAVYLLLADIYEKCLDDKQKAIENLRIYAKMRSDLIAEERLEELSK